MHSIHRGVYALLAPAGLPPLSAELAAVLACGPGALLSHHSAAAVWGIRPPRSDGCVDVTVIGRETGRRRPRIRVHRVRKARLRAPEVNATLGNFTADFLWRRERVVVEVDAFDTHRGRWAFERDRRRDGEHMDAGFLVIRLTGRQLAREPELILVRLASALARRDPQPS